MNMLFFVFALTALVLGTIGVIVDGWDWVIPLLTISGIAWCFMDCVREEKKMAHRTER